MDEMCERVEVDFYDENTVTVSILFDETDTTDPSKLKFVLLDGTELKLERSDDTEQANGKAVYQVTGIKG
jgi:Fe-S-cluster formation regulator IscX/YfhJ